MILDKTVYLETDGNNSTGVLISNHEILTVRHAFSTKQPDLGTLINVKIYPYKQTCKAKLVKYSQLLDVALLRIIS